MRRLTGYSFVIFGFALITASVFIKKNIIGNISNNYISLVGVVLIILGVFFFRGSKEKRSQEVPIYDKSGKQIIGYRRVK